MLTTKHLDHLLTLSLLLISFTLPFDQRILNFFIILLFCVLILSFLKDSSAFNKRRIQHYFCLSALYLPYLIFFFRGDPVAFDLNQKIPLLLFPLLLFVKTEDRLLRKINYSFTAGTGFALGICLLNFLYDYFTQGIINNNMLFSSIIGIHPTYLALFTLYSMSFLIIQMKEKREHKKIFFIALIALSGILLLASRLMLLLYPLILFLLLKSFLPKKVNLAVMLVSILMISLFGINRLQNLKDINAEAIGTTKESGINQRALLWSLSYEEIKENFLLGSGLGNENETLANRLNKEINKSESASRKNALRSFIHANISPHNQFLHMMLGAGLIGLLFLLWIFIYPLLYFKKMDLMYLLFLLLIAFIFMTESFLETQRGIIFYSLMNVIAFSLNKKNEAL